MSMTSMSSSFPANALACLWFGHDYCFRRVTLMELGAEKAEAEETCSVVINDIERCVLSMSRETWNFAAISTAYKFHFRTNAKGKRKRVRCDEGSSGDLVEAVWQNHLSEVNDEFFFFFFRCFFWFCWKTRRWLHVEVFQLWWVEQVVLPGNERERVNCDFWSGIFIYEK